MPDGHADRSASEATGLPPEPAPARGGTGRAETDGAGDWAALPEIAVVGRGAFGSGPGVGAAAQAAKIRARAFSQRTRSGYRVTPRTPNFSACTTRRRSSSTLRRPGDI